MDVILSRFMDGGRWVVHCGGGVGRAGTVLACLVAMLGRGDEDPTDRPKMAARTAIALVRTARPTSIETRQQEAFVSAWVSHRWRRADTPVMVIEPVTHLVKEGTLARAVVMIGRPGSGKSWLAAAISKRTKAVVVSGDVDGRAACERAAAQAASLPDDTLFLLDRCNPTTQERREWLALLPPAMAVYFDYTPALCSSRLATRIGHPIRAGRGANALAQMDRLMSPPSMEEGWTGILRISSFAASRDAALLLGGIPPLLKFPRTPHLLDLGAAAADDLVSPADIKGPASVEEKLDGANMGLSLDWDGKLVAQNRSHWVSSASAPQFRALDTLLASHDSALRRILGRDQHFPERYILYGEWMAAPHSVHYASLPALFVAFDLYDRVESSFVSRTVLERTLRGSGTSNVPLLKEIREGEMLARDEMMRLLQQTSVFGTERLEGVYVRFERDGRTVGRGKVVRSDFIASDAHWGRAPLVLNRVAES
ncbi:hypothetical protein CspHIS471_0608840 [Cutaneotrichosporon sp. HIS471]|nr:hypothetical protein CspHIS471_0608840 [Cutaneotrichosporon sp. HIS471]